MIRLIDTRFRSPPMCRRGSAGFFLIVGATFFGDAQTTTASLLGNVRDKTGAAIPQAEVIAQNVETSLARSTMSDESGAYLITNLPVGDYVITAQKQGFTKY